MTGNPASYQLLRTGVYTQKPDVETFGRGGMMGVMGMLRQLSRRKAAADG